MSALVGVSVAPISTSGLTSLPIIPPQQQHFRQQNMSEIIPPPETSPPFPARERRWRRGELSHRTSRHVSRRGNSGDKRRRSVNVPAYHHPKYAQLVSVTAGRCIEVRSDGHVRTGSIHSPFGVFEFVFCCHVFPFLKSCSVGVGNPLLGNVTCSAVLFRFKASGRYLCVDKVGEVYSLPVPGETSNSTNLEECVFQSAFLSDQYDLYYSARYPTRSNRCRTNPTPDIGPQKRGKRACRTRWYLGVDRTGGVRTFKTAVTRTRQNTLFIRHWLHQAKDHGLPSYHHPHITTSHPTSLDASHVTSSSPTSLDASHVTSVEKGVTREEEEGLFEVVKRRGGKSKSKKMFSFLSARRRNSHRRREKDRGPEAEHGDRKSSRCDNLLRDCRPEVESSSEGTTNGRSLTTTRRKTTRTEITNDQSQRR